MLDTLTVFFQVMLGIMSREVKYRQIIGETITGTLSPHTHMKKDIEMWEWAQKTVVQMIPNLKSLVHVRLVLNLVQFY